MNTTRKTVLVAGATGRQGGAVARRLLEMGWAVRAMTRDPYKQQARRLGELGAEIVQGDLDEPAGLEKLLRGVHGVFSVQNSWEAGPQKEIEQGKALARIAGLAGVKHFVYTSVGGADYETGIPFFQSKWEIEQHIRLLELPATILRPVFFMENFEAMREQILQGELTLAMNPDKPLQMIHVEDIGGVAAMAFEDPQRFIGQTLELAGDELTMVRAADVFGRVIGRQVTFVEMPIEQLRSQNEDYALMFEWFNRVGYQADIAGLRKLYPQLATLETYLYKAGWNKAHAEKKQVA